MASLKQRFNEVLAGRRTKTLSLIEQIFGPVRFDRKQKVKCRVCGCTMTQPCDPPCCWAPDERGDLCSTCAAASLVVAEWMLCARHTAASNAGRLLREAEIRFGNMSPYVTPRREKSQ